MDSSEMQPVCDRLADVAQTVPDHPGLVPGIHVFMVETSNKKTWREVPSHDVSS
jgi:hypothetical protein